MRQSTMKLIVLELYDLSKLPMRQSTHGKVLRQVFILSKLPMRQSTLFLLLC